MADLVLVHRDTGQEVLLNRDHILYAEIYDESTDITLTNGTHLLIREKLVPLRDKPT